MRSGLTLTCVATTNLCKQGSKDSAHALANASKFFSCALREGGARSAPHIEPERASDMHPQAPNTQTCLPACPLLIACDYYGLDCFDPIARLERGSETLNKSLGLASV